MFTIKHRTPYGNEALYEATRVSLAVAPIPEGLDQPSGTSVHHLGVLVFSEPGETHESSLHDGMVYVMNENGSTVSRYDLGGWNVDASVGAAGSLRG